MAHKYPPCVSIDVLTARSPQGQFFYFLCPRPFPLASLFGRCTVAYRRLLYIPVDLERVVGKALNVSLLEVPFSPTEKNHGCVSTFLVAASFPLRSWGALPTLANSFFHR